MYLSKWFIIACNSLIDSTLYWTEFLPCLCILPTPNVNFISSKILISLICTPIEKIALTLQLVLCLTYCKIKMEKEPSASENPVKNQGFSLKKN